MRCFQQLCLIMFLILAGCTAGPLGNPPQQEKPVPVVINNSANVTQTFEIWVVEGELNNNEVKIIKKNGKNDSASPGGGLTIYRLDGGYGYVTSIEVPSNRSRLHDQFMLAPNNENESIIENSTIGSTVMVVHSENGRVVSLVAAKCSEQSLVGLKVTSHPATRGLVSASYRCPGN